MAERSGATPETSCGTRPEPRSAEQSDRKMLVITRHAGHLNELSTHRLEVVCIINFFGHETIHVRRELILKNTGMTHDASMLHVYNMCYEYGAVCIK